jgi:hypothetical protein
MLGFVHNGYLPVTLVVTSCGFGLRASNRHLRSPFLPTPRVVWVPQRNSFDGPAGQLAHVIRVIHPLRPDDRRVEVRGFDDDRGGRRHLGRRGHQRHEASLETRSEASW